MLLCGILLRGHVAATGEQQTIDPAHQVGRGVCRPSDRDQQRGQAGGAEDLQVIIRYSLDWYISEPLGNCGRPGGNPDDRPHLTIRSRDTPWSTPRSRSLPLVLSSLL